MVITCLTVHPRRSLRLGISARELAFHLSFAKRRDALQALIEFKTELRTT